MEEEVILTPEEAVEVVAMEADLVQETTEDTLAPSVEEEAVEEVPQ